MPKEVRNQLTARRVKTESKPGRYADGNGLYLVVSEHGARWWQWRGSVRGRRREIGMGSAYLVPLVDARATAADWRAIARSGGDPAEVRDKDRRETITFEEAARQVWRDQVESEAKNPKHIRVWIQSMESFAFPALGSRDVAAITQADVLTVLAPIWTEKEETARRVRQRMKAVLDWARVSGYCDGVNPVEGVERALPRQKRKVRHMPAVPYDKLPEVFASLAESDGMAALALRFAILTAARSGEVREAAWVEIDREARVWTVPGDRMKTGEEHRVPLSEAALAILDGLPKVDDYVFPGGRPGRPLSDAALGKALRTVTSKMGIEAVPHGFRSTLRDWTEETTDTPHAVAEMALAHSIPNAVEKAYRRGDLFDKRRVLMDRWAEFATSPTV
ncbi:MAG: integrase arm-type DNA-binding domain-containing protein [Pseudomonadota bacterium]